MWATGATDSRRTIKGHPRVLLKRIFRVRPYSCINYRGSMVAQVLVFVVSVGHIDMDALEIHGGWNFEGNRSFRNSFLELGKPFGSTFRGGRETQMSHRTENISIRSGAHVPALVKEARRKTGTTQDGRRSTAARVCVLTPAHRRRVLAACPSGITAYKGLSLTPSVM